MRRMPRAIGTLAAIIVSLVAISNAAAQSTDSEEVGVDLVNQPCVADLHASGGSFGAWQWNGSVYEETSGVSTLRLEADLDIVPVGGCDLTLTFAGLVGAGGTIGPEQFRTVSYPGANEVNSDKSTYLGYPHSNIQWDITLESVPNIAPGHYEGTYHITVANAV